MPENGNGNKVVEDSVIKEQSETIKTLSEQLKAGELPATPQIIFAPSDDKDTGQPNYIMLIGLALGAWFLLRR